MDTETCSNIPGIQNTAGIKEQTYFIIPNTSQKSTAFSVNLVMSVPVYTSSSCKSNNYISFDKR